MENTLENKAKLFAQYFGQNRLFWHDKSNLFRIEGSDIDIVDKRKNTYFLQLKPLSSLNDEDKIKITLMHLQMVSAPRENVLFCFTNTVKPLLEKLDIMQARITDYLRSKGYALSYMGLSVEKQIEYGWVKLEGK
ncbi:hypothetical protein ACJVDH_00180 [Pedobacter sp. AW1-32]|uniref:hypothetical protein n=1 Tax=Pedobacter sp. AW1-32 TaxID=3383026 RepID=UPI003FEECBBD